MSIVLPYPEPEPTSTAVAELEINLRNTAAFINADPITITLEVRNTEDDGAGGYRTLEPTPRAPQTFRLIPANDTLTPIMTPDGSELTPTYTLLGMPSNVMARWDVFEFGGVKFMIVGPVSPDVRSRDNAYQIKASVARV